jgi:hypothetical protein
VKRADGRNIRPKKRPAHLPPYIKHPYKPGGRAGQCVGPGRWGLNSRCNQLEAATCHRYYVCQHCGDYSFTSVEMRDRHEADVHGSGW